MSSASGSAATSAARREPRRPFEQGVWSEEARDDEERRRERGRGGPAGPGRRGRRTPDRRGRPRPWPRGRRPGRTGPPSRPVRGAPRARAPARPRRGDLTLPEVNLPAIRPSGMPCSSSPRSAISSQAAANASSTATRDDRRRSRCPTRLSRAIATNPPTWSTAASARSSADAVCASNRGHEAGLEQLREQRGARRHRGDQDPREPGLSGCRARIGHGPVALGRGRGEGAHEAGEVAAGDPLREQRGAERVHPRRAAPVAARLARAPPPVGRPSSRSARTRASSTPAGPSAVAAASASAARSERPPASASAIATRRLTEARPRPRAGTRSRRRRRGRPRPPPGRRGRGTGAAPGPEDRCAAREQRAGSDSRREPPAFVRASACSPHGRRGAAARALAAIQPSECRGRGHHVAGRRREQPAGDRGEERDHRRAAHRSLAAASRLQTLVTPTAPATRSTRAALERQP